MLPYLFRGVKPYFVHAAFEKAQHIFIRGNAGIQVNIECIPPILILQETAVMVYPFRDKEGVPPPVIPAPRAPIERASSSMSSSERMIRSFAYEVSFPFFSDEMGQYQQVLLHLPVTNKTIFAPSWQSLQAVLSTGIHRISYSLGDKFLSKGFKEPSQSGGTAFFSENCKVEESENSLWTHSGLLSHSIYAL